MTKLISILTVVAAFSISSLAVAADKVVKHVEFNAAKNAFTVTFEDGTPTQYDSKQLVIKLDANAKKPVVSKGNHLSYLVFPSFKVMNEIAADMKP